MGTSSDTAGEFILAAFIGLVLLTVMLVAVEGDVSKVKSFAVTAGTFAVVLAVAVTVLWVVIQGSR